MTEPVAGVITELEFPLMDAEATERLGRALAAALHCGGLIELLGDLGAGKTTFSRGLIQGLGHEGRVKSPTYTLMESYALRLPALHMDLYRMADAWELEQLGLEDFPLPEWLWLVEWPQRAQGFLPPADCRVLLRYEGQARAVQLQAMSPNAEIWLDNLARNIK